MKDYFSIGEAAEMVDMTPETLRHYDRIGLVKPSFKDQWTSYRYYSPQEIIRLHTIRALRYMDMSLAEIKKSWNWIVWRMWYIPSSKQKRRLTKK